MTLYGSGFVDGYYTSWNFGSTSILDGSSANQGPDVYSGGTTVNLTVPLNGAFGPITVTTGGGTSAALSVPLTGIVSTAMSGTPANGAIPSANPGQAITVTGSGLSLSTPAMMNYTGSDGVVRTVMFYPSFAKDDGSAATFVVPAYANGITTLSMLGSSTVLPLQIVPTLSSYYVNSVGSLRLYGTGLQEGSANNTVTYNFTGGSVSDTAANSGPDVQNYISGSDNNFVDRAEPVHGFGTVTTTTAGGTSAPLTINELQTGDGLLRSLAMNTANPTQIWVGDNGNPAALHLIDTTTGQQKQSIAITKVSNATNANGNTSFFGALQVVQQAFTLRQTPLPAGTLLVFYGPANPDYVVALNPTTGTAIGNLPLVGNYDATAGVYDPKTGEIFLVDRNHSGGNRIVGIYAATNTGAGITAGTEDPAHTFASPFNLGDGALALDPSGDGTLWLASDQSGDIVHMTNTGTILKTVSLFPQAAGNIGISGMVFDASGNLLVSTNQGNVLKVNVNFDAASFTPVPTLGSIAATATDGTPANGAIASADANQVITLTGTNFNAGTEVVFQIRDVSGNVASQAVAPLAINAAGTQLQVEVPALATTGAVQVVNVSSRNLGYASYNDALYRGMTVQFTAQASNSSINFADAGLEGISNESWGIDNVSVSQGNTTIFSDNFESGAANPAWSLNTVDTSAPGVFSDFLGRFSNGGDTLNLTGLTAGQTYTLKFDLYAIDSLDGQGNITDGNGNIITPQYGPDQLNVTVDGSRKLSLAMANYNTSVQNFNGSATLPLQIVPNLTGMDGSPSGDGTFNLFGSGFQAGAMTVTVGGVVLADSQFVNQTQNHVIGAGNGQYRIASPLTLDGPVKVTTAGGSMTLPGYHYVGGPGVQFTGIVSIASNGSPAGSGASANIGQTIVLTGQGFTSSTLVQFSAEDQTGTQGTVTRTGTASADGRSLSIVVPELARTGNVTVLGGAASFALQVVPLARSVGGTVAAGNTIEIETTGVTPGELTATIDGHAATVLSVRDTVDINQYGVGAPIYGQQLVKLLVPSGVGPGVIVLTTPGGSTSLSAGVSIANQTPLTPGTDAGDTLATATAVSLPVNASIAVSGTIGDGANGNRDVDLYQVTLSAGESLNVALNSTFYANIRFFNAAGQQLGTQFGSYVGPNTPTVSAQFVAPASGTYYVGITGYNNVSYDPTVSGSGGPASYTGNYALTLERMVQGGTRISGIVATAGSGTPTVAGVASANVGATITLTGTGLTSADQIVFTSIDDNGSLFAQTVNPATVASDGTSLTVVVPAQATTGTVHLARDQGGILLQVVPILSHVDVNVNGAFNGGGASITGSGFAEGLTTLNFGAAKFADIARDSSGLDVYSTNHNANFTVPNGVDGGPLSVTTPGGTSAAYGLTFTGITATATSGTPVNGAQASANPGQTITITGTGLDTSTDIVFRTVDDSGNKGQVVVHPATAAVDGTSATVVVPTGAVTDVLRIVGDSAGNDVPLQIVPVLNAMTVNSVASDGSSAYITLHGFGFVDGNNSAYVFGTTVIPDANGANQGPDVYSTGTNVNLTLPLNAYSYGPVVVKTAGGTSAPISFTATLSVANATATSGTPANSALPSANPGQTITLTGTGLTTSTAVIASYNGSDGVLRFVQLNPATAAQDGTSATLVIPSYFNGITNLGVIGAPSPITLQIVPVLTSAQVIGTDYIRLYGRGLQEGSAGNTVVYNFAGGSVSDTAASNGPDVQNNVSGSDNTFVDMTDPVHGFGTVTTTTAGGTSAPMVLNEMETGDGYLRDIAVDLTQSGQIWVMDNGGPAKMHLLNVSTGQEAQSITLTAGGGASTDFGSTNYFGGMQIVPVPPLGQTALTLNGVAVPAGSILLFNGATNPDRIVAVNPATGTVIASLVLTKNYDTTAGVYDPFSGHLYILDRSTNPNSIVAINPANGQEIANSRFNLPANAGEAGLALDPAGDGTFWYGGDQSNNLYHLSATGTVLKIDDLTTQGIQNDEINGLSFDSSGKLLVASRLGMVYRVTV